MDRPDQQNEVNGWDALDKTIQEEVDLVQNEITEIDLMLEQSQFEVNKLTQRNTTITTQLQQVQGQLDNLPRVDIRDAYESALDAKQRLFFIRGQVEKLQSDRGHLERYTKTLAQVLKLLERNKSNIDHSDGSIATVEFVEMMVQAQEAERLHLSRQMHDGPAQALSNLILQSEIAMRLFDLDQMKAREELANLKTSAMRTFQKVRDFIFELRPMMLDDLGLVPTIKRYIDIVNEQSNIDFNLEITGSDRRLETYLEVMAFRAIQEFIINTIRHSQATEVKIHVDISDTIIKINVDDNGTGFDVAILEEGDIIGIKLIKERAEMLGGQLDIDSLTGQGTRITLQIPAVHIES